MSVAMAQSDRPDWIATQNVQSRNAVRDGKAFTQKGIAALRHPEGMCLQSQPVRPVIRCRRLHPSNSRMIVMQILGKEKEDTTINESNKIRKLRPVHPLRYCKYQGEARCDSNKDIKKNT